MELYDYMTENIEILEAHRHFLKVSSEYFLTTQIGYSIIITSKSLIDNNSLIEYFNPLTENNRETENKNTGDQRYCKAAGKCPVD